jgi:hypothetical protein
MSRQMPSSNPELVGLPIRPFLYSLPQIANILDLDLQRLKTVYIYYHGRSVGPHRADYLAARNIAPHGEKPDWHVAENELVRWMKRIGFRVHERSWSSIR